MPFQPGVSGNPGGRPKGLGKTIRETYGEDGERLIARLNYLAFPKGKSKIPHKVQLDAIRELLDRGWGKAPQMLAGDPHAPILHRVTFGGRYRPDVSNP